MGTLHLGSLGARYISDPTVVTGLSFDSNGELTEITATTGLTLGAAVTSKLGFYGTPPIVQPSVPLTDPALADVVDALVALGLVAQVDPEA